MKTDIFKYLVPLRNMTFHEINQLAYDISEENKDMDSYLKIVPLIDKVDYFLKRIKKELNK